MHVVCYYEFYIIVDDVEQVLLSVDSTTFEGMYPHEDQQTKSYFHFLSPSSMLNNAWKIFAGRSSSKLQECCS